MIVLIRTYFEKVNTSVLRIHFREETFDTLSDA